jgi:hypothetical protein
MVARNMLRRLPLNDHGQVGSVAARHMVKQHSGVIMAEKGHVKDRGQPLERNGPRTYRLSRRGCNRMDSTRRRNAQKTQIGRRSFPYTTK